VTFAAGADGQLGLVAPFAVVVSWLRGKRCRDLKERRDRVAGRAARGGGPARKEAGPIAPARRHVRAALGASGAGARLFAPRRTPTRPKREARAGRGGAPVHRYYLE
jgi:hypothetical protein